MIKSKLKPLSIPSFILIFVLLAAQVFCNREAGSNITLSGELKLWHPVTLIISGPQSSETNPVNPFSDYRLNVVFSRGKKKIEVPGFYAADGKAGTSGADSGNKWKVFFLPGETGEWHYLVSFRKGKNIAVNADPNAGSPVAGDGLEGRIQIRASDKSANDFRSKGILKYVGKRYLQFAGSGEYFIKGGADSPENFLAYADFDGTKGSAKSTGKLRKGEAKAASLHRYQPHLKDWRSGDPTWKNGKGKSIIGALNYLAGKGINSVYFLTMNLGGDGDDVWPWISHENRKRFDCSKLEQWEIVFSHMDKLGLMMHVITQEQENDQLLNGGELGVERKLYYRELIARFAHHPALVWNLGEENTNTDLQRKNFAKYIKQLDPCRHPVVVHTFPNKKDSVYTPLLGYAYLDGPSLQMSKINRTHSETVKWIDRSAATSHPWFVCLDEQGPAQTGVKPDADDFWHDNIRKNALWANLMAGGAGCEWYFGYKFSNNDLNCEDWRSRDHLWELTTIALDFFEKYLPFNEMYHADMLTPSREDFVFAKEGEIYAIYLPNGGTSYLDLQNYPKKFAVRWFNPRTGGALQTGSVKQIQGRKKKVSLGYPPDERKKDWVILVKAG